MLIEGLAQASGVRRPGQDTTVLIVVNAHHGLVRFTLPECTNGTGWELMLDTNTPERDDVEVFGVGETYGVTGRSFLLFALVSAKGGRMGAGS